MRTPPASSMRSKEQGISREASLSLSSRHTEIIMIMTSIAMPDVPSHSVDRDRLVPGNDSISGSSGQQAVATEDDGNVAGRDGRTDVVAPKNNTATIDAREAVEEEDCSTGSAKTDAKDGIDHDGDAAAVCKTAGDINYDEEIRPNEPYEAEDP